MQAAAQGGGVRVRAVRLPRLLQGLCDEGRHRGTVRTGAGIGCGGVGDGGGGKAAPA